MVESLTRLSTQISKTPDFTLANTSYDISWQDSGDPFAIDHIRAICFLTNNTFEISGSNIIFVERNIDTTADYALEPIEEPQVTQIEALYKRILTKRHWSEPVIEGNRAVLIPREEEIEAITGTPGPDDKNINPFTKDGTALQDIVDKEKEVYLLYNIKIKVFGIRDTDIGDIVSLSGTVGDKSYTGKMQVEGIEWKEDEGLMILDGIGELLAWVIS